MTEGKTLYRMAQRSRRPGADQAFRNIIREHGLHKREVLNRAIKRFYCVSDIWHAGDMRGYQLGRFWRPEDWIRERYK